MAIRASDFFRRFPDQVLKGLGQVMLQENRWTGLFFLLGLFSGGWVPGLAALLGAVAGTATAKVLK
jgi:urea transporter